MRTEVEAKFVADDPPVLAELARAPSLAFAGLGPARAALETDRYLDTPDGALASSLWACRLRERDGSIRVSLKGPAQAAAGAWHHRRPEVEGPATTSIDPDNWPDSEARRRLLELSGGGALVERLTLHQERTERAVLVEGVPVATLSLDVVDIVGGDERDRLHVVELELSSADALPLERFEALATALAVRPGLWPDPRSKLEHALARHVAR